VANGCIVAIVQASIAPEYQGRVFTMMMSLAAAMTPIGLLLATPVADALGVRSWYLAGGLVCVAMGAAAFLVRSIAQIESSGAAVQPAAPTARRADADGESRRSPERPCPPGEMGS
jgi:DHA3 family macrolide efflux protein-like MFS transporter